MDKRTNIKINSNCVEVVVATPGFSIFAGMHSKKLQVTLFLIIGVPAISRRQVKNITV
jgi:hypothetical protein